MFEYYGGKGNLVRWGYYPPPAHSTIIEPFCGAARYSLFYYRPGMRVILIDANPIIISVWEWLKSASEEDFLALPFVEHGEEIPRQDHPGATAFLGFALNQGSESPRNVAGKYTDRIRKLGWSRYLHNLRKIKTWEIICGDYTDAPDIDATWFVDPPYSKQSRYPYGRDIDYSLLADFCQSRCGQVIVCENSDAMWLPFRYLVDNKATQRKSSKLRNEGVWINS